MITEEQVRTAIAVLDMLTMGELQIDDQLVDELESAIGAAYGALGGDITCDLEDAPPLTASA